MYVSSYYYYISVLILLLHMCPHTTIYVSSYDYYICVLILLLHICPHTTAIHVSSYRRADDTVRATSASSICVYTIYVSSNYYYISVLIRLLYMCPHTGVLMILYERHQRRRGSKFWNSLLSLAAVLLAGIRAHMLTYADVC